MTPISLGDAAAVVGLGCRFPAAIETPEEFWTLLDSADDVVKAADVRRWAALTGDSERAAGSNGDDGVLAALLDDIAGWDADFFECTAGEAVRVDPQHRLLVEVAWRAVEDAAIDRTELAARRTGVFVGVTDSQQYLRVHREADPASVQDPWMTIGTNPSAAASRVAHYLRATGPAMTLDTACSSGLVAIHLAVESLRRGECEVAVVAVASAVVHAGALTGAFRMGMGSSERCRSFDRFAKGAPVGEGAAAVVLERVEDARRLGHRVRAAVLGSAVNQSTRNSAMTGATRPDRAAVMRSAVDRAAVSPAVVSYVEAHAAGPAIADATEIEAMADVFGPRDTSNPLLLGALKPNIGHPLVASGMASFLKAVMVLERGSLPPNLHYETPNPMLRRSPWLVPATTSSDLSREEPAVAGVSSFGWSGANAHVVVAAPQPEAVPSPSGSPCVLTLSASNEQALDELAEGIVGMLIGREVELADVAHTLHGRAEHRCRRAVVADDVEAAVEALRSRRGVSAGVPLADGAPGRTPAVIFGDAYVAADGSTRPAVDLFAAQLSAAAVLARGGIRPAAVMGVGVGAYTAAHAAGVLDEHAARSLVTAHPDATHSAPDLAGCALTELAKAVEPAPARVPLVSPQTGEVRLGRDAASPEHWCPTGARQGLDAAALADVTDLVVIVGDAEPPVNGWPTAGSIVPIALPATAAGGIVDRLQLQAIATLWEHGVDVRWRDLLGVTGRVVTLPPHPLRRVPYWPAQRVDARTDEATAAGEPQRRQRPELRVPYVPPRTPLQSKLVELWEGILHVEPVGIDDAFFELGGTSGAAVAVAGRVEEIVGSTLDLATLFDRPTVRELANALESVDELPGAAVPVSRAERDALRIAAAGARRREMVPRSRPKQ